MTNTEYNLANLWPRFSELLSGTVSVTTPQGISALVVLVLFILFGVFAVLSVFHFLRANHQLRFYRNLIKDLSAEALLEKRRDILKQAEQHKAYFPLWREFDESLVHVTTRQRLCNTLDAEHFFNTHSLARRLTDNRLLAAVPGFLTAIGVIGTFAGLQMGLAELDVSSDNFNTLKQGIAGLIGGASIAFMTSVWGVITSVTFNFFEKFLERNIRSSISNFQNQVDYLYPRITAEQSLTNIEDFTKQSMEKLAELDEKIGHKMQEAMQQASDSIRQGMEQSLTTILGPAIEKLVENAHNGSEKALESLLERFMEGMGEAGNSQRAMMDDAANGINSAALDMTEGLAGFSSKLDGQIEGMMEKNAQLMVGLEKVMEKQTAAQNDYDEKRQQQFDEQIKGFQGAQTELTDGIGNMLQSHEMQFKEIIDGVESLLSSFNTLAVMHEESSKAMQVASSDIKASSNQFGLLSTNLKDTTDSLSSQLEQLNEKVIQTVEENKNNLVVTERLALQLENIQGGMDVTATTMNNAAEKAENGLTAVDRHFNQLMQSLDNHIKQLNKQVVDLLDEYSERVKGQTVDRMNTWNEQSASYIGAMTDAVRTINAVVDEIDGKVSSGTRV